LLALLFALQANRHSEIKLTSSSGILVRYSYLANGDGKLIADVKQADFDYLLNALPLDNIIELDLRQTQLPIATLQKLVKFTHLRRLSIKENNVYDYSGIELDDKSKLIAQRQDDIRHQALWALLIDLQAQLHCDIKLIKKSLAKFEQPYIAT